MFEISDAKDKRRTSSRQDEAEWIQYSQIMDVIIKETGIEKKRFIDIRGNHDKYGVPNVGHKLDFFSTHSISSQLNRFTAIQSISLLVRLTFNVETLVKRLKYLGFYYY